MICTASCGDPAMSMNLRCAGRSLRDPMRDKEGYGAILAFLGEVPVRSDTRTLTFLTELILLTVWLEVNVQRPQGSGNALPPQLGLF
jgi:hypothetical protein